MTPAYRNDTKGSEELGSWGDFVRLQGDGYQKYRLALSESMKGGGIASPTRLTGNKVTGSTSATKNAAVLVADVNRSFAEVRFQSTIWKHATFLLVLSQN